MVSAHVVAIAAENGGRPIICRMAGELALKAVEPNAARKRNSITRTTRKRNRITRTNRRA
jgi:hypothetical protein